VFNEIKNINLKQAPAIDTIYPRTLKELPRKGLVILNTYSMSESAESDASLSPSASRQRK